MQIALFYKALQMKFAALISWNAKKRKSLFFLNNPESYSLCFYAIQTWNYGSLGFLIL